MMGLLAAKAASGLKIFETMVIFFANLREFITTEYILYGGVGLLFLLVLITLMISSKTYEVKALKYVKKLNRYFKRVPQINEDNLIYVNNSFKKAPKNVRYAWQQYMLNRDKIPSDYINTRTCLDQPLKSSAHDNTSKVLQISSLIVSLLAFIINLACMLNYEQQNGSTNLRIDPQNSSMTALGWLYVFLVPVLIYILGSIFVIILKARHTAIVGDVYTEFQDFERYLNKACSTMPSYIDYEVLFTRREIREGIPALQEYLEKRALQEQKEREEEEMRKLNLEQFDFSELGIENSLLLERAMTEGEKFFNVKRALNERISAKQTEMINYQKNFDEVTKEFEKKAQTFRENLKQLNEQLNNTSVNIEANYIKKRYREDQQKLQQLEKDYEIATIRFNKQQSEIDAEVDNYKKDIQRAKEDLERAMKEEGKTYANKIFGIINDTVVEQNRPIFEEQEEQIASLQKEIEELTASLNEKQGAISDLKFEKEKLEAEIITKKSEIEAISNVREYLVSPEFRQVVIDRKKARKDSGIDSMNIDELRDRVATAEEQLKIANDKHAQMVKNEDELLKKLKRLEEIEVREVPEVKIQTPRLTKKQETKIENEVKPVIEAPEPVTENIQEVNKNIEEANNSLKQNQADLLGEISKTLEKLEEGKASKPEEKPVEVSAPAETVKEEKSVEPKKKTSISSLTASMNKLKSKAKK